MLSLAGNHLHMACRSNKNNSSCLMSLVKRDTYRLVSIMDRMRDRKSEIRNDLIQTSKYTILLIIMMAMAEDWMRDSCKSSSKNSIRSSCASKSRVTPVSTRKLPRTNQLLIFSRDIQWITRAPRMIDRRLSLAICIISKKKNEGILGLPIIIANQQILLLMEGRMLECPSHQVSEKWSKEMNDDL